MGEQGLSTTDDIRIPLNQAKESTLPIGGFTLSELVEVWRERRTARILNSVRQIRNYLTQCS